MRDCKLIVTVRDDKVNFEGQDISVEEFGTDSRLPSGVRWHGRSETWTGYG